MSAEGGPARSSRGAAPRVRPPGGAPAPTPSRRWARLGALVAFALRAEGATAQLLPGDAGEAAVRVAQAEVLLACAESRGELAGAGVAPDAGQELLPALRRVVAEAPTPELVVRAELAAADIELAQMECGGEPRAEAGGDRAEAERRTLVRGDGGAGAGDEDLVEVRREIVRAGISSGSDETAWPERAVRRIVVRAPDVAGSGGDLEGEIWRWPIAEPRITSRFGPRIDPVTGEEGRMHRGLDFGAATGTPVLAPASGTVVLAGACGRGTGNCVVLDHLGGWRTQYFHLAAWSVEAGDRVSQGQEIGEVGSTGRSTGPHLHFQIGPVGGSAQDPEGFFGEVVR